jgi:iron complex outermembrane receptor protein
VAENQQHAAVAVDVHEGSELIAAGITQVDRLGQLSPALTVIGGSTGSAIFMRGVGNFTVAATSDPAIAFNYDGVYVGRPSSTTGVFYDLARVEILKGPQGTLYGRNATGGAINVIPAQPRVGELSGYGTFSYGNYDALTAEGAVNMPLGDTGALRFSAAVNSHDGYLDDGTTDGKNQAFRFQLLSHLTPSLSVRLAADYDHDGGLGTSVSYAGNYVFNPGLGHYIFVPSNVPLSAGFYSPAAQAYRQTVTVNPTRRRLDALMPLPFQNNNFYGVNAEINWDAGFGTITLIPAWRRSQLDFLSTTAAFLYRNRESDDQYSVEARLTGNRIGIFDYTIGALLYHEAIDDQTRLTLSSSLGLPNQTLTTRSLAPFGRVTAHLSDRLRLVGGIRYTSDHKTFHLQSTSGALVCLLPQPAQCPAAPLFPLVENVSQLPFPFPAQGGPPIMVAPGVIVARTDSLINSSLTNSHFTFRGAVEFDLAPRSLLYASVETGYRSGGFSAAAGYEHYDPEYITAYTLGVKNRFLGNRLQLNVEAFLWNYRNQQVNHVGLDLAGRTANFTENIGSSRIYGVELEGQALITPTTLFSADVQYLHAENRSFVYTQGVASGPPAVGCPYAVSAANPALYNVDCSSFPAYNSPRWTVNLAAQQTIPMGTYQIILGADTQFKSSSYIGFQYLAEERIASNWRSSAQILFGRADDRWSIAAYVRNIENNRTPLFEGMHPTANILAAGTLAPLTYGARLSFRF